MARDVTSGSIRVRANRKHDSRDVGRPGRIRPKDAAVALSLSNLAFLSIWSQLIGNSLDERASYGLASINGFLAVVTNVLLLATVFYLSTLVLRRSNRSVGGRAAQLLFSIFFLFSMASVVHSLMATRQLWAATFGGLGGRDSVLLSSCLAALCISARAHRRNIAIGALLATALLLVGNTAPVMIMLMLAALGLLLTVVWHRSLIRAASIITLILFPFVPMTLFQAGWLITKFQEKDPAPFVAARSAGPRIIWMIFDELDYKISFEQRPAGLELPEIDRLRSASIFATNAYPPADFTLMSMPALISGRFVSASEPENPSRLMITLADSAERVSWGSQPSVFTEARELGVNGAIVGWYHPYCRIIGDQVVSCMSCGTGDNSLPATGAGQLLAAVRENALVPKLRLLDTSQADRRRHREQRIQAYREMLQASVDAVSNPQIGLLLLHFPVPHPPGVFNRASNEFDASGNTSYLDELKLVDNTVGELRQTMERAGLWEDAVVVLSSDHWWRGDLWRSIRDSIEGNWTAEDDAVFSAVDERVPFILKLPRQNSSVTYTPEFNTVLTHDLFLALLKGNLSDRPSVVTWLDTHRSIGARPYKYKKPR